MLTRDQLYEMILIRNRENSLLSALPNEVLQYIAATNNPLDKINEALRLAASSIEEDMVTLVAMINANPRLLLQAGNVMTRGGVEVIRTTLYEFFLGAGDPDGARRIQFGFAKIPNGEAERLRQYSRYKPHIDALAKQIELKIPAYDLIPLFETIKQSSKADIKEALNLYNPNMLSMRNTPLRKALVAFRKTVAPKVKTVGMHYDHYATLRQAFYFLFDKWENLFFIHTSDDICFLIWRQIIGFLQRSLSAIERFAFSRGFKDKERTLKFKEDAKNSFPDYNNLSTNPKALALGFDEAIYGKSNNVVYRIHSIYEKTGFYNAKERLVEKIKDLQNLSRIQFTDSPPRPSGA